MIKLFDSKNVVIYDEAVYNAFIKIATEEEKKLINKSLLKDGIYFINNSNKTELYKKFFESYVVEWVYDYKWDVVLSKKIHVKYTQLSTFMKDTFICFDNWYIALENEATLITKDIEKYLEEKNRAEREKYFKKYISDKRDEKLKLIKQKAMEKFDDVMINLILSLPNETIDKIIWDSRITLDWIRIWEDTYSKDDIYKLILEDQKSLSSFYKLFKTWDIESILDYITQWLKK